MISLWGSDEQKRRIYEALWLGPVLKKARVRHVHVHFAGIASRTAFWLHKLFGITYSVTAHANDIFRDEPLERLAQVFHSAATVVTVSDFSVRYLCEKFPDQRAKFHRVYNGIETTRFTRSDFSSAPPLILSVGRYIEKKGFSTLIDACAELGGRDFRCLIIGTGPLEETLRRQAAGRGLTGRVEIAGPRTEGQIKQLMATARLFALACLTEADGAMDNLPTVIMEAMAASLPVVSTRVAAVPEMVEDGKTGFVLAERDPQALAAALARLLDDRPLSQSLGQAGHQRCLDLFDAERTSASLAGILQRYGQLA